MFVWSHSFQCEHPICLRKIVDVFVQHCIDFDFQEVCIYGSSCQKSWRDGCWFLFLGGEEDRSFFFPAGFSAESIRALHLFVAIALCSLWWSRSWRGKTRRLSEGMRDGRGIITNPHLIHQSSRIINEKIESHEKWSLLNFSSFYVLFDFHFFLKIHKTDVIWCDPIWPGSPETRNSGAFHFGLGIFGARTALRLQCLARRTGTKGPKQRQRWDAQRYAKSIHQSLGLLSEFMMVKGRDNNPYWNLLSIVNERYLWLTAAAIHLLSRRRFNWYGE